MADTFALDIAKFAEKVGGNVRRVVQKTSVDMFSKTVDRTPVGYPPTWKSKPPAGYVGGRLRANWSASLGHPSNATTKGTDARGEATKLRISSTVGRWEEGDIYLMNSLPYVRSIEYTGHSSQAPAGMVRITVTEFQTFVANAVRAMP